MSKTSPRYLAIDPALRFREELQRSSEQLPSADPTIQDVPVRVRGEHFDQQRLVTYGFDQNTVAVSLLAVHKDRAIVVQVNIARDSNVHVEMAALSSAKTKIAEMFLIDLRKQFSGLWPSLRRFLKRETNPFQVEGPFMPAGFGIASMALIIRVSRDGNFDTAYEWAQRFLELHPRNDDRAQLLKQRDRSPKPTGPPPYAWTAKEMSAVERMARLEPCEDDDDPWDLLRRAYNDSVFGEIQRDASESASDLLRKIFQAEN